MFSFPALRFGVDFSIFPRQRASPCVGLVLVLLILLRLDRIHTRPLGLRAGNLIPPMDIVSVLVVCRRLFSLSVFAFLIFVRVTAELSAGPAWRLACSSLLPLSSGR